VLIGGVLISIGTVLGNSLDADVTDIRVPLSTLVGGAR
jgi:formate/nitrite transporter FocA (FNT family)